MGNKKRRFVLVFDTPTAIRGKMRTVTTATAKGPIDAFRKATGYKGKIAASNGYSQQVPARKLAPYVEGFADQLASAVAEGRSTDSLIAGWHALPPMAYCVPLGKW